MDVRLGCAGQDSSRERGVRSTSSNHDGSRAGSKRDTDSRDDIQSPAGIELDTVEPGQHRIQQRDDHWIDRAVSTEHMERARTGRRIRTGTDCVDIGHECRREDDWECVHQRDEHRRDTAGDGSDGGEDRRVDNISDTECDV